MNAQGPLVSRMSIFIVSYFLVESALVRPEPGPMAAVTILAGCLGFICYFALDLSAFLRSRALVCDLLAAHGRSRPRD